MNAQNFSYFIWRSDDGCRPVLAGPLARTRFPVILFDDRTLTVVVRYLPAEEQRFLCPAQETTTRAPLKRFRSLARRAGASKAAKEALGL